MIVLDAAVLIAYLDGNDPHHVAANEILEARKRDPFQVSAVNLAEAMVRPVDRGISAQVLDVLLRELDISIVPLHGIDVLRLAELRASTSLKLPDCCVLFAAERTGAATIATFDLKLQAVARGRGLIVLPG